jgi:Na+/melibiose symporter-like transporter
MSKGENIDNIEIRVKRRKKYIEKKQKKIQNDNMIKEEKKKKREIKEKKKNKKITCIYSIKENYLSWIFIFFAIFFISPHNYFKGIISFFFSSVLVKHQLQ